MAGFIGVSNLMPAAVVSANGSVGELQLDSGVQIRADGRGRPGRRASGATRSCARRSCESSAPTSPRTAIVPSVEGIVESSLYLGTATQFVVRLPDGVAMTVLVPNADEAERQRLPAAGVPVRLAWATEHMHVVARPRDRRLSKAKEMTIH